MGSNLRTKETIVQGESEGRSFYEITEASRTFGWRTFDHSALEAYQEGIISEEVAMLYCSKRGVVSRGIDRIKKERGEAAPLTELRMRADARAGAPAKSSPPVIKLK
jgi:twitching motility protein PilT